MILLWLLSCLVVVVGAFDKGCSTIVLPGGNLIVPNRESTVYYCGTTGAAPGWLITAASCLRRKPNRGQRPSSGGSNQNVKVFENPQYDPETQANDIALVKMSGGPNANDQEFRSPLCLSTSSDVSFQRCVAFGLKCTDASNKPVTSQQIDVQVVDSSNCEQPGTEICVSVPDGYSCELESCGSLVCQEDGMWYLAGVAPCDRITEPPYFSFTNVGSNTLWIAETIEAN